MSTHKRLFLVAAYDKDAIIDDALIYYVKSLCKYGDIILCIDSDCDKSQVYKMNRYTLHTIAKRHGEYDFGSYKRAYEYARDKKLLKNYKFLYLVNDSVFGPMFDVKKILKKLEHTKTDAASIITSKHKTHSFMESWFIRLNQKVFLARWFNSFLVQVKKEDAKHTITIKYEHGLTNLIQENGCSWQGLYTVRGRKTYNNPKYLFKNKCPFVKKMSFTRHNGALGKQIKYILKHADESATSAVMTTANRLYGEEYMKWFLTSNPIKVFIRNITYILKKITKG